MRALRQANVGPVGAALAGRTSLQAKLLCECTAPGRLKPVLKGRSAKQQIPEDCGLTRLRIDGAVSQMIYPTDNESILLI